MGVDPRVRAVGGGAGGGAQVDDRAVARRRSAPRPLRSRPGLGAASSSCSYAAVALARSLFRKGANFTAAMAFEIASTNLVVELGIILALLMGWQFTAAEFVGGPIMIVLVAVLFRLFVRSRLIDAGTRAGRPRARRVDGGPRRDGHVRTRRRLLWRRLFSENGFTSCQPHLRHGVGRDSARPRHRVVDRRARSPRGCPIGSGRPFSSPTTRPRRRCGARSSARSSRSRRFVCSIGNVPLAAVLWNGGISFGGVVAFIFADLLILPILNIYRKYYGTRMMFVLLGTFYAAMVIAGYLVELLFGGSGSHPDHRRRDGDAGWHHVELHHLAEHRLPRRGRGAAGPVHPNRRHRRCCA